jgi:5-methylcytosine-specific restriction endonuclease McrA
MVTSAQEGSVPRLTVCPAAGCPELVPLGQRCDRHKRKPWSNTSRRNLERPADWPKRVGQVRHRDKGRCRWPGCRRKGDEVDHIVEVADGGSWELDNLRLLCTPHHKAKTAAARAARAERRAG